MQNEIEITKQVFFHGNKPKHDLFALLKNLYPPLIKPPTACTVENVANSQADIIVICVADADTNGFKKYLKFIVDLSEKSFNKPIITISKVDTNTYDKKDCGTTYTLLDSGIWFRHITVTDDAIKEVTDRTAFIEKTFNPLQAEIEKYIKEGIYKIPCATEYRKHFMKLLALNFDDYYQFSNLINLPSETKILEESKKRFAMLKDLFEAEEGQPLARCLIVGNKGKHEGEGYVERILKIIEALNTPSQQGKKQLETLTIERPKEDENPSQRLKDTHYDILMLDYETDPIDNSVSPIELIQEIKAQLSQVSNADTTNILKSGTGNLFWILPVTRNPSALFSHMQKELLPLLDKGWYLSRGADPINNPNFFFFKLVNMLSVKAEEAGFIKIKNKDDKEVWQYDILSNVKEMIKNFPKEDFSLENIVKGNDLKEDCLDKVQFKLIYAKLVEIHSRFKQIRKEQREKKDLLFPQAAYKIMSANFDEVLWARLINMFHLFAYGSQSDWVTVWDDALHLKQFYRKKAIKSSTVNIEHRDLFNAIFYYINKKHN